VDINVSVANEGHATVQSAELNHGDSSIMWVSESNSQLQEPLFILESPSEFHIKNRQLDKAEDSQKYCNPNLASRAASEPKRVHEVNF
jgi:hypothetical protein